MHHPHVRYRRTTILLQKLQCRLFKKVQLVQTQHHGAKMHKLNLAHCIARVIEWFMLILFQDP